MQDQILESSPSPSKKTVSRANYFTEMFKQIEENLTKSNYFIAK
jgi:hypothetical protein